MEDQQGVSGLRNSSKLTSITSQHIATNITSMPKTWRRKSFNHVASKDHVVRGVAGGVASFFLKVAALETTRRFSRAKCPFVWRSLQAFQMLCYPPFKWIQRWAPFKGLVHGMQMLSRPLLVLSIATALSGKSDKASSSDDHHDTCAVENLDEVSSSAQPYGDARSNDKSLSCPSLEKWLLKLYEELERQGISLPERINESELRRFYLAANGDFSSLLLSIKKTIRWRETFHILSEQELEVWSHIVFWHGYDLRDRPCLIVRLGVACTRLPNHDRPRFAQAVVSQMEHGILHLADRKSPQIMVLVDCEGLSPFRLPMQMIRSCALLFQDHFPHCLGGLYVIRLPPVIRVMVQTLMKVLKPVTQQKLKFLGQQYQEILSEFFQELPACLGGKCKCSICISANSHTARHFPSMEVANQLLADGLTSNDVDLDYIRSEIDVRHSFDQVLRTGMIGLLMFCVLVAFLAGLSDLDRQSNLFL
ncbi:Sec14 cytosolic factor [Bienertia sinuspersici]